MSSNPYHEKFVTLTSGPLFNFFSWINQTSHTYIIILMFLEMFLSFREYPRRSTGIKRVIAFFLIYVFVIHLVHFKLGIWAYPLLEVLNLPLKIAFYGFLICTGITMYIFGEKLNKIVWSQELLRLEEHDKRKKLY